MNVIIAGTRDWTDYQMVVNAVEHSRFEIDEVVSGGAPGVDELGVRWAQLHDRPYVVFPADWERYGRAAGPIRNREMAEYADALIAVWDGKSPGTKNMIAEARKKGLQIYVHRGFIPVRTTAPLSEDMGEDDEDW